VGGLISKLIKYFPLVMCFTLLISGGYIALFTERGVCFTHSSNTWFLANIKPKQTFVVNCTIVYTEGVEHMVYRKGELEYSLKSPINIPEYKEWDILSFDFDVKDEGGYFDILVYKPSGAVLDVHKSRGEIGGGMAWTIKETGTYRIQIININSSNDLVIEGRFIFTRHYEHKPFLYLGYIMIIIGVIYLILIFIEFLKDKLLRYFRQK